MEYLPFTILVSTGDRRISEPSTVAPWKKNKRIVFQPSIFRGKLLGSGKVYQHLKTLVKHGLRTNGEALWNNDWTTSRHTLQGKKQFISHQKGGRKIIFKNTMSVDKVIILETNIAPENQGLEDECPFRMAHLCENLCILGWVFVLQEGTETHTHFWWTSDLETFASVEMRNSGTARLPCNICNGNTWDISGLFHPHWGDLYTKGLSSNHLIKTWARAAFLAVQSFTQFSRTSSKDEVQYNLRYLKP